MNCASRGFALDLFDVANNPTGRSIVTREGGSVVDRPSAVGQSDLGSLAPYVFVVGGREFRNSLLYAFGKAGARCGDRWNPVLGVEARDCCKVPSRKPVQSGGDTPVFRGGLAGGSELSSVPFE